MGNSKKKIVIIGAGNVGATVAYTIMLTQDATEIVLIDVNRDKARGEMLDMNHGIAFFKQVLLREGDYSDCADATVIIISAGIPRKPGQTRIDLTQTNVKIAREITREIMQYNKNPLILVISNPVDILTYVIWKESGISRSRVIGSGTTLDTGRFRYLLSKHCKVDVRNVHGYILGEHGDSEVPIWSATNIAGKPFDLYCEDCPRKCEHVNRDKIFESTKNAGAEIIKNKGATYYGIALAVSRIVSAITNNEYAVLSLSMSLNGEYGLRDVALSLPCAIGSEGVDRVLTIPLSDEEMQALHSSGDKLKEVLSQIE